MILAWLLLLTGLIISAVAIYYSVVGLTAIFAAAAIPIIVMGSALEVAKLVCATWLKANWDRVPLLLKTYMCTAVVVLMVITSMGIFGFLSKAHLDQNIVSGDVQSKIAIYDEKIKTERENIDAARTALSQMDAQVNERLSRSTDDRGAERAVQIRRQQQAERTRLQNDISRSQGTIAKLNEERAPIAAEVRKVEAEVGPIKYIAALIYGNDPDANLLEKAVTWVIILIVVVFDPLAVIMLLAAQMSFQWRRNETPAYQPDDGPLTDDQLAQIRELANKESPRGDIVNKQELFPIQEEITPAHTDKEVPSETPSTALGGDITAPEEPVVPGTTESELDKWNKMVEEAEKAIQQENETVQEEARKYHPAPDLNTDVESEDSKKKSYMTKDQQGKIQIRHRD
jgi:peptidoglycan hydrolase CwlO-like protein